MKNCTKGICNICRYPIDHMTSSLLLDVTALEQLNG